MNVALAVEPASAEELVKRAKALIPSLRERAARIAEERTVPEDVWRDLYEAGLIEVMRPRRFGGEEHSVDLVCRIGRELAKGDGATSWVYMVTASHDAFMLLFPENVQAEYWNSKKPIGASSYAPTGKAAQAEGGFVLNGRWSFCSGIDHSGWVLVGAVVGMLENPKRPDIRYFLLPESDFTIIDDWYLMGLRGTGSKSVEVKDVFVPNERMLYFDQTTTGCGWGPEADKHPDYKESTWVAIGYTLVGPATCIAQRAYEQVVEDLKARLERGDPAFVARKANVMGHLGEVSALIEASDLLFNRVVESNLEHMHAYQRLSDEERARNRRDMCFSVQLAKKAAEKLMEVAGASGLKEHHPAQRALRDIYAIASHPAVNWDSPSTSYGSVALGGRPTEFMI